MAKDDYYVIAYRLLVYLYACLKRRILFDEEIFEVAVRKHAGNEAYFNDVLRMMQDEFLISGVTLKEAWSGDYVLTSELRDMRITPAGIQYLTDDGMMEKVAKQLAQETLGIAKLADLVGV